MNIAYTMAPGPGRTDLLLAGLAERLHAQGLRTCGTVQINSRPCGGGRCDMDVRVLPDGPVLRISQDRGPEARGCRLDPDALETAVARAHGVLREGADVVIINKFGKHEAEGRGFRQLIAEALEAGVPVLAGLGPLNAAAFHEFTGGIATELAPSHEVLVRWLSGHGRTRPIPPRSGRAPAAGPVPVPAADRAW
jgi:nucleoside-triphosphatase THEP1